MTYNVLKARQIGEDVREEGFLVHVQERGDSLYHLCTTRYRNGGLFLSENVAGGLAMGIVELPRDKSLDQLSEGDRFVIDPLSRNPFEFVYLGEQWTVSQI